MRGISYPLHPHTRHNQSQYNIYEGSIQMSKFTQEFTKIWLNPGRDINIEEYEYCLNEWKIKHDSRTVFTFIYTIILFGRGLWAFYESNYFIAVLLLLLADNFNSKSNQHVFVTELMDMHKLLAMLINSKAD